MKKFIAVFVALLCIINVPYEIVNASQMDNSSLKENVSNRIIIKYKNSNDSIKINSSVSSHVKSIKKLNDKFSVVQADSSAEGQKLYNNLKANSKIDDVEYDKVLKTEEVPDDLYYNQQWYINSIDEPQIWNYNITSKKNVTVAVIDSGIDYNHEDLNESIAQGGYNFLENNTDISDDNGHGTEVSGIIAAKSNNIKGIAGVSSSTNLPIKILPLKTADSNGDTLLSNMISAIDYAISQKVDVINLSMGSNEYSNVENDEIQKAINNGIVVVAAAGNDGNSNYTYPASYDNVISAGAIDSSDNKASFSNYNDKVGLSAPGVNMLTTNSLGSYSSVSGTSFSTPIIAASAAIIKSVRPDLNVSNIRNTLENDAKDLGVSGKDNYFGYGKVDLFKSLSDVLSPKSISISPSSINLEINKTSSLTVSITPDNALDKNVTWSSSNSKVAQVDQSGCVKGISAGNAVITAKTEMGNITASTTVTVSSTQNVGIQYEGHVQNIGWQNFVNSGEMAGTTGQGLRMEAFKINVTGLPTGASIKYQAHVQNIGWQNFVSNGAQAGTTGQGLRMEAIRIYLENAPGYSVTYQAHVQNIGWQDFVSNGAQAGTTGQGLRMEALRIKITKNN